MHSTNKYRILEHVTGRKYKGKGTPAHKKVFDDDQPIDKLMDEMKIKEPRSIISKPKKEKEIKGPLKFRFD